MKDWTYDATRPFPILLNFDANGFYTDGTTIPSAPEVLSVMQGADYNNYIENYVWKTEPAMQSIFFEVTSVEYMARVIMS